jgi:hypothetical protein
VRGPGSRLVLVGVVAQAVAFIFWTAELLDARYVVGSTLIDPLWVLGLIATGAGGAITAHGPARRPRPSRAALAPCCRRRCSCCWWRRSCGRVRRAVAVARPQWHAKVPPTGPQRRSCTLAP